MTSLGAVTPTLLAVNLVDAWLYGSLLAAVAVALTLVFGLGRVVNFAIGSFYALGAVCAYSFRGALGYWPASCCATLGDVPFRAVFDRSPIRILRSRAVIHTRGETFGLS